MFTLRIDQIEALAHDATWRARLEFVQQLAAQGLTGQLDAVGNSIYLTDAEGSCSVLRLLAASFSKYFAVP